MPKMISDLPVATVINDADVFAVEQAGVSKKISWASLRDAVSFDIGQPKKDDLLVMTGSGFLAASEPRWRAVPQLAYVASAVANFQSITFSGVPFVSGVRGQASYYFSPGDPVRVTIAGDHYYGICYTATATTLYIVGPPLPVSTSITKLEVGSKSMIRVVSMRVDGTAYNTSTSLPLTRGCRHRWRGKTGHLTAVSFAHMNTSAAVSIMIQLASGINAFDSAVAMNAGTATTYGAYKDQQTGLSMVSGDVDKVKIDHNGTITITTPVITGSADWPIFHLYFVVP